MDGPQLAQLARATLRDANVIDFLSFFVLIQIVYQLFAHTLFAGPDHEQERKRSWVITTFSAFCSSIISVPFVFDLFWCNLDWTKVTPHHELISNPLSMFFLAYLVSDLLTGLLCYRKHVNMSSGWVHHTIYAMCTVYWVHENFSHAFATALIMEIPTWVMGLGALNPRLRSYWAFTISFLITRIVLHLVLLYSTILPTGRYVNKDHPSYVPIMFFVITFPMHAIWAYKSVRGLRRRMRKLKAEEEARLEARRIAVDEATRLLDSADELEQNEVDVSAPGAPKSRVQRMTGDRRAHARRLVSDAVYVLWYSAPEAWRQAYLEELEFSRQQGVDLSKVRRSTLIRRALARHLLLGNKRGHNVPLVEEDDEDELEDWMSITSMNTYDSERQRKRPGGRKVRLGKGINITMPRELDPIFNGQRYVVSEFPVDREASGSRRQRIVGQMRRRFEVARRDMVVF